MQKSRKSPSRAPLRREGDSPLFFKASRVKLIHGLLAPLRPTTTYVHGSGSLTRFHGPLCSKEHVELIPSGFANNAVLLTISDGSRTSKLSVRSPTAGFPETVYGRNRHCRMASMAEASARGWPFRTRTHCTSPDAPTAKSKETPPFNFALRIHHRY